LHITDHLKAPWYYKLDWKCATLGSETVSSSFPVNVPTDLVELQTDRQLGEPFLTRTFPLIVIINLECMVL
jgi:hypothetical protein